MSGGAQRAIQREAKAAKARVKLYANCPPIGAFSRQVIRRQVRLDLKAQARTAAKIELRNRRKRARAAT